MLLVAHGAPSLQQLLKTTGTKLSFHSRISALFLLCYFDDI